MGGISFDSGITTNAQVQLDTHTGNGTQVLRGSGSFTSNPGAGTVTIASGTWTLNLGTVTPTRFSIASNATLALNTGVEISEISGDGTMDITGCQVVYHPTQATTFSPTLTGNGEFIYDAPFDLTVAHQNFNAGTTLLKQGALVLANSEGSATGTSWVHVIGATIKGSGTITGGVTASSGSVSPGVGDGNVGHIHVGSITFGGGLAIDMAAADDYDSITSAGMVNVAGALDLRYSGAFSATLGQSFPIVTLSSIAPVFGTFAGKEKNFVGPGNQDWAINYTGGIEVRRPNPSDDSKAADNPGAMSSTNTGANNTGTNKDEQGAAPAQPGCSAAGQGWWLLVVMAMVSRRFRAKDSSFTRSLNCYFKLS